jgi:hypothetical protein
MSVSGPVVRFSWRGAVTGGAKRRNQVSRCQYNGLGARIAAVEYDAVNDEWTQTDYYYSAPGR